MFIECWGTRQPCIYDLLLCCLYIDVKENIICQNLRVFLLFMESLMYQKPNVSSIISSVSWAVVTAVTACVSEPEDVMAKNLFYKLHRLQFQFSISGLLWVLSWKLLLYIYLLLYFVPLGTIPRNYTTFKTFSWKCPAFKAKCVTSTSNDFVSTNNH